MPDSLEQQSDSNSADNQTNNNFRSNFTWEHPLLKVFGFGVGDVASMVALLNTGGLWATFFLGLVVAFTLGLIYSITLTFMENRRKQSLISISIIPEDLKRFPQKETKFIKPNSEEKKQETPFELSPEQRPVIQARLVVNPVNTNKIESYIQLENIGKIVVKNIRVGFYTKGFQDIENEPYMTRTIPLGGKISVSLPPTVLKPKKAESLVVKVLYNAEFNSIEKEFLLTLLFLYYPKGMQAQTIEPDGWEESDGNSHVVAEGITALLIQLTQSHGTVFFVLSEFKDDGSPNLVLFTNEFRSFSFDSVTRIVSFKMKIDSGRIISLDLPLPQSTNEQGNHLIGLSWDYSKGGFLSLNGVKKKEPENFD